VYAAYKVSAWHGTQQSKLTIHEMQQSENEADTQPEGSFVLQRAFTVQDTTFALST
jgi:hypothetical protein